MDNINIWLCAAHIVGITIIAMFAVYVLLQFVDLRHFRSRLYDREEELKKTVQEINNQLTKIHNDCGAFISEIENMKADFQKEARKIESNLAELSELEQKETKARNN